MSLIIQLNNKPFACKKSFIRNNPCMNEFLLNGSYIINLEDIDIEPYQDFLTNFFLNHHYQITESDLSFLTQLNKKIKSIDLQIKIDKLGAKTQKVVENISNHPYLSILIKFEDLLLDLSDGNYNTTFTNIESMLRDKKINVITLIRVIFGSLFPCIDKIDLYIDLLLRIDRTIEIKAEFCDQMVNFCEKSKNIFTHEMCFIINKMIDRGLIEYNGFCNRNPFFMHFMKEDEIEKLCQSKSSKMLYLPEIKGDNFQQHRNWCKQGKNEHKIAEFIRNDDLDQIKKSDIDFVNFDHIPASIYECHEIFGLRAKHAEYAALYGAEKCFDFFIENTKYSSTNDKLARCAIIGGNNSIIKKCIKMNLMTQNCLETALIYHRNELFEWLLDQKNSFSITSNFYEMSLFYGCFKAIQIMIQHGVNPSSFLYHSVICQNVSILHWNLLLDPEVNFKNGLMVLKACEICDYKMMKLLARYPHSDFNCHDKFDGSSCLHVACKYQNDVRIIKLIIDRMKMENIKDKQKDGFTALHFACIKGNVDIVKLLLETNLFDLSEITKNGFSSIYFAACNKNEELVGFLLTNFTEKIKSFIDEKTIHLCYDLLNVPIAALLFEMTKLQPSKQTLSIACEKNNVDFVNFLFEMINENSWKFDLSNKDLILACKNGFSQIAQILIENNVEILPNATLDGKTSLHYACKNGMKEVVELLVSNDQIDLNLTTKRSKSSQSEKEMKFNYQDDDIDFSYDDEYEDEEEVIDCPIEIAQEEENLQTDNSKSITKKKLSSREIKRQLRKEMRQKKREQLQNSFISLKDSIDQETKEFIFNEESDEYPIDIHKFDKFINEICLKRKGRSAISIACRNGYLDIVLILLKSEKVDLSGTNLLFDSIYSNNNELIIYILDFIEQHNKGQPQQMLPLTSLDETPLQFACRVTDNVEIFNYLYERFKPTKSEEEFNSYYYNKYHQKNNEFFYTSQIKVFENNFDFEYYCNENLNNLFKISIENRHPKIGKFILDKIMKSEDLKIISDCLLTVCKTPYKDIVRATIRNPGMSRLFEIENLDDIIYEVCMNGRIDNLKVLIKDLELDVGNMIFHQSKNILHLASKSPNSEILEYIISMTNDSIDINMNEPDGDGYTALMLAAKKKNLRNTEILFFNNEVNRSLIKHKQSIFSLCYRTGQICFVDLLRQVKSFGAKDENLILHSICASGSVELLRFVIDNKIIQIDQSTKYLTKEGFSCFHTAIMNGSIEIIDKLVKYGLFDINTRAGDGRTPLQIAVDSGNFKTVDFLLKNKVNSINSSYPKSQKTVLHKAVKEKMFDIVCLLLMDNKINLNSKNSNGKTPEEICDSPRIKKMFDIKNSGENEDQINQKLKNMILIIHKADQIKEKFEKFCKLNRKIRFDYHVSSYEFDESNDLVHKLISNSDNFDYRCCSSSSSDDDDDDDYDENMDEMNEELAFIKKKNKKSANKKSRGRYRNRKKFQKSQKQ